MSRPVGIGNAQAFWGDSPGAPLRLLQQQPNLDYLTLDYLSELSLSIMAVQREKDPQMGYAQDFVEVIRSLVPLWRSGVRTKVIANAGGLNPQGCAQACMAVLRGAGLHTMKVGVVFGDNVLASMKKGAFDNLETGQSVHEVRERLATANAYLGAHPITEALEKGADIVITGRVADPSLTVAPCVHHFGWQWDSYDRLAGATIAGHLIECGTQVTGGMSTNWLSLPNVTDLGFPIVEVDEEGHCVVTKPKGTGGCVSIETVKEQLLYEIGDPDHYLSPDVTVSFLGLQLQQLGEDRVYLIGARGKAPPPTYKVSATYRAGFKVEGMLTLFGREAERKARCCGDVLLQRVKRAGFVLEDVWMECLGSGASVPGVFKDRPEALECVLRICAVDSRKEALECLSKELASLVTSGPQGVTGYASGRPRVRPVFGYWPCLITRESVIPQVEVMEVMG